MGMQTQAKKKGFLSLKGFFLGFLITVGIFLLLLLAIYIKLLFSPISLERYKDQLNQVAIDVLPNGFNAELGKPSLALENAIWPVVQFSPVVLEDVKNSAKIEMEAIHLGFSPVKALFGNPSVRLTLIKPQIKIIQDLHGPRLSDFEFVQDNDGKNAVVWVMEGEKSFPLVDISSTGLSSNKDLSTNSEITLRSDNDLISANFMAIEQGLAEFANLSKLEKISNLTIKDGAITMHDSVYGLFRELSNINFEVNYNKVDDLVEGVFSTKIAGRDIFGSFKRKAEQGNNSVLIADIQNIDFASILSFLDDPNSLIAVKGSGSISLIVNFDKQNNLINDGVFHVEPSSSQLRIRHDLFPLLVKDFKVSWLPKEAKLIVQDTSVKAGNSFGIVGGEFYLGLDKTFGPTLSMSVNARDVFLHPSDLDAPISAFDSISFSGWMASLYGALGIDELIVKKNEAMLFAKGRADFLRKGIGLDIEIGGSGVSSDDLKRLWPYFIATSGREWFVENVKHGEVKDLKMFLDFAPGTLPQDDSEMRIPDGSVKIDLVGENIHFIPWKNLDILEAEGLVNIKVRDYVTTASLQGATLDTKEGPVSFSNSSIIIDGEVHNSSVFELSGDILGDLPAIISLGEVIMPDELEKANLAIDPHSLNGKVKASLLSTFVLREDEEMDKIDYAANGIVSELYSKQDIGGYSFENGNLSFAMTQLGYNFNGAAQIAGFDADIRLEGAIDKEQKIIISTILNVEEMKSLGFESSDFLEGSAQFFAQILPEQRLQITADLKDLAINIIDIGIKKEKNIDGQLQAIISQKNGETDISEINLAFEDVSIKGNMQFDEKIGFKSANFSTFGLNPNDNASLIAQPVDGGLEFKIFGDRMDLKPMLKRSFAVGEPSTGGVKSSQYESRLLVDIDLKQAIGFYGVVAHNFNLDMDLKGSDLRNVSLQAQFSLGNGVSIVTNPIDGGRTLSVAFDDGGTLLRFLNIYSRLLGGKGILALTTNSTTARGVGELNIANFSLVDESKIADIIGADKDSRSLIANENRINFKYGKAKFIRTKENIEIIDGVLDGGEVGGTLRGFIHTNANEYDLTGTYIPLFGLNSIFQKIPLFGVILGGREGEGLIGVTFAIRGKLDDPTFVINPVSILAPGMFRSLFEFRAREVPTTQ